MADGAFQQRAVFRIVPAQKREVKFRRGKPFQIRHIARVFRRRTAGDLVILFLVVMLPVVLEGFVKFGAAKVLFIRFHSEQIVGADAEQVAERQKQRDVGHRRIGLPTADRLRGNGEQLGKLLLRELCFPALFPNSLSNGHRLSTFLKMLLLTGTPAAYGLERRPLYTAAPPSGKAPSFPAPRTRKPG